MRKILKKLINALLRPCGLMAVRRDVRDHGAPTGDRKNEGFDHYLRQSKAAGSDINDWLESEMQWSPALPALESAVFPILKPTDTVCEIGPGTGRHARHIVKKLSTGSLLLADHSPWCTDFLKTYFAENNRVQVVPVDGFSIPQAQDASVDLVFSNGTFIELKLGVIDRYAREAWRMLKREGRMVFDYFEIGSRKSWEVFKSNSDSFPDCYTYHTAATMDALFEGLGFQLEKRVQVGNSTYVTYQKP